MLRGSEEEILFWIVFEMAYNLKSIKKDFAEKGVFYTPPELAEFIKSFIPQDVQEVYDPTC